MSNVKNVSKKLSVKDLINTGIFTVIYFVIFVATTATAYIPLLLFVYPVITALIAGIPMILFYTKVKKFGMVTISGVLVAIIMFLMGYGPIPSLGAIGCALVADFITKTGEYKSWGRMLLSYIIFSEWGVFSMTPIFIMGAAYFEPYRNYLGDEFVERAASLIQGWMIPAVFIGIFIASVIGAYLGKAVLKKHFKRAGIL